MQKKTSQVVIAAYEGRIKSEAELKEKAEDQAKQNAEALSKAQLKGKVQAQALAQEKESKVAYSEKQSKARAALKASNVDITTSEGRIKAEALSKVQLKDIAEVQAKQNAEALSKAQLKGKAEVQALAQEKESKADSEKQSKQSKARDVEEASKVAKAASEDRIKAEALSEAAEAQALDQENESDADSENQSEAAEAQALGQENESQADSENQSKAMDAENAINVDITASEGRIKAEASSKAQLKENAEAQAKQNAKAEALSKAQLKQHAEVQRKQNAEALSKAQLKIHAEAQAKQNAEALSKAQLKGKAAAQAIAQEQESKADSEKQSKTRDAEKASKVAKQKSEGQIKAEALSKAQLKRKAAAQAKTAKVQSETWTFVGQGVAGPAEVWNVDSATGLGKASCYAAVMADPRCTKDYFTYATRGDMNCGCKGSHGAVSITYDNNADYFEMQSPKYLLEQVKTLQGDQFLGQYTLKSLTDEDLTDFWKQYDKDGRDELDMEELRALLEDLLETEKGHRNLGDDAFKACVSVMDTNKDGVISFEEFSNYPTAVAPTTCTQSDTGGTCMLGKCDPSRGSVCGGSSLGFKCYCPDGKCAVSGACQPAPRRQRAVQRGASGDSSGGLRLQSGQLSVIAGVCAFTGLLAVASFIVRWKRIGARKAPTIEGETLLDPETLNPEEPTAPSQVSLPLLTADDVLS